ncbi:MAG: flavin reductase family protein [Proteobacteria bacterium]|nr:flavin reductase family protein [Pseudomonadota bacterium]MBU6425026.1 flavin reductase family protein [Rhodospirillales bacterium]
MKQKYFYEPAAGHGLAHDPLNAIVGPRPIGWISTIGGNGNVNLAPYSFFNGFCYTPPIIGFSSNGEKDTLRNARETGEFVWNLVDRKLAVAMNQSSAPARYGVDEFELAGLKKASARLVAPPMVAAAGVNFECRVSDIIRLKGWRGEDAPAWLVLGEVVGVHIKPDLLKDGVFDTFGAQVILRAGGPTAYTEISPDSRFDMRRPE